MCGVVSGGLRGDGQREGRIARGNRGGSIVQLRRTRMLIERLANEPNLRIDDGRTQRRCAVEALALDSIANGFGMKRLGRWQ
jgi:hypothetical protein